MSKNAPLQIVTANDLLDGDVVFLTPAGGWDRDLRRAQVARSGSEADRLLAKVLPDESEVVGPYLADAALDAQANPVLLHYREQIRTLGPSNRTDLGRQAEANHV